MNTLIIVDDFLEPPSEILPLRTITMLAHDELGLDVLLHTTQDLKDIVYKFAKPRGLMDYISYILHESEFEEGIRIDIVRFYPDTVVTKYIRIENQLSLLGQIKSLSGK